MRALNTSLFRCERLLIDIQWAKTSAGEPRTQVLCQYRPDPSSPSLLYSAVLEGCPSAEKVDLCVQEAVAGMRMEGAARKWQSAPHPDEEGGE